MSHISKHRRLKIRELDLDLIRPSSKQGNDVSLGGSKIVCIGAPSSGKTTLIKSILYNKAHICPAICAVNGTEDSNHTYSKMIPSIFVHNNLDKDLTVVRNFIKRQKIARAHLENPWGILLLDDTFENPQLFNHPIMQNLLKNSRHYCSLSIIGLQFALDVRPFFRTCIDGTFILREPNIKNRHKIYENYAGIIPDFTMFCSLLDQITTDYTALFIHNTSNSNDWRDCVFWYKAKPVPENFRFGCKELYEFHEARYDQEYKDPIL